MRNRLLERSNAVRLQVLFFLLAGGIVAGSLTLLAGEPGIGKSTLVAQIADALSANHDVLYTSGEVGAEEHIVIAIATRHAYRVRVGTISTKRVQIVCRARAI